jgi:hypothetical protein
MLFKGVWGFDPEEALRAQNRFRQTHVSECGGLVEIDCNHCNELRIPETRDLQVSELLRMFLL